MLSRCENHENNVYLENYVKTNLITQVGLVTRLLFGVEPSLASNERNIMKSALRYH